MKALTLTQPWATLVILGIKHVETRSWATRYEGPLAIHAAKGWTRADIDFAFDLASRNVLPLSRHAEPDTDLPRGAVLGTVELLAVASADAPGYGLVRAVSNHHGRPPYYFTPLEYELGDYSPGRFAWVLGDPVEFPEPIPARGALGLWNWEAQS